MATANINPEILTWARERLGFSVAEIAKKLRKTEKQVQAWENGEEKLTFKQAMTFSKKAYIPFGYLFLSSPPEERLPLPDLRTIDGHDIHRPSVELMDLLKLMLFRQEWYKDYLRRELVASNPIVSSFHNINDVNAIVNDMRLKLGMPNHPTRGYWDEYYRELVNKIESVGILVMRQSDINHNSRPLNVDEFRGFAIADNFAPMIFVNHADAPGPRLFTLIHELCHIWIGQSGISDGNPNTHRKEEILCNAVAAEFLVPEAEFRQLWDLSFDNWRQNLPILESHFHVSKWTLARRALSCSYIVQSEYATFIREEKEAYKNRDKKGAPTHYKTKKAQISQSFSKAVVSQALTGRMLLRDAGDLLGMKPNNIYKFAKELQI